MNKVPSESSAHWLLSNPGTIKVPTNRLELFICRNFADRALCDELIALIDRDRRPSTIADPNGDHYFRTSETCDLDGHLPAVSALFSKITMFTGIAPQFAEPMQGQRYDVGQEFKQHTDYFEPSGDDYHRYCSVAGQRSWTFMLYLNDVEAGGATRFKVIDKTIQPEAGKLVCWNNRRPDGTPNPATLHQGMKVRRGLKYVITQWYRERPWGWE